MNNTTTKLGAFIKLIRPKTLIWFGISSCYGFASIILNAVPPGRFVFLVLTIVFANIGAIIVNDIGDVAVDAKSLEPGKRQRPLVTGRITIKEATILAILFFMLSLGFSLLYGIASTLFSISVIVLACSYSLPPFKFCAYPYSSILYWIVLCLVCYPLMILSLSNQGTYFSINLDTNLWKSEQGWIFILAIILFMGIAEIIAKDLRDRVNDAAGGRNTFVNFVDIEVSTKILIFFAWIGFILWMEALYIAGLFPHSVAAWLCAFVGFIWCVRLHYLSLQLIGQFKQSIATALHQEWTYAYALMQGLTILSFYLK